MKIENLLKYSVFVLDTNSNTYIEYKPAVLGNIQSPQYRATAYIHGDNGELFELYRPFSPTVVALPDMESGIYYIVPEEVQRLNPQRGDLLSVIPEISSVREDMVNHYRGFLL